jgi:hypothetical protein
MYVDEGGFAGARHANCDNALAAFWLLLALFHCSIVGWFNNIFNKYDNHRRLENKELLFLDWIFHRI